MISPRTILRQRFAGGASTASELLRRLREFFHERGFTEVETPLLANEVIPELHIEPIHHGRTAAFLQASPELHMKRLLAAGARRSFRSHARSAPASAAGCTTPSSRSSNGTASATICGRHGFARRADATLLGTPPAKRTTYAEAFQRNAGICPHTVDERRVGRGGRIGRYRGASRNESCDRDEWLNLLLATRIEPQLGRERPEIVYHYPASQASLAKVVATDSGYEVAERFELYYRGIELANGFHELTDAAELRRAL